MIHVTIPLIPGEDGVPLIPADRVTALLRAIAVDWMNAGDDADPAVDRQTVDGLAGVLDELADSIDVECIAFTSTPEDRARGGE
ncbi:hypothetical protein CP980_33180 [Streptomyces vinaceus]|uniref:Uncharacterized protein n=1 Tax=Streptomyces vinaceus TaxID=1960 RepID=A0A5J6JL51_STRVI|nr:DUF6213 family protein [Streptomyces vinaceus]QEV49284.1 hypothetical protein CP980_33180 [Streptomyces vinaceus]GHE63834.1 hypothetical protein GCM10017778_55570 [Streptomyces vinaceus]